MKFSWIWFHIITYLDILYMIWWFILEKIQDFKKSPKFESSYLEKLCLHEVQICVKKSYHITTFYIIELSLMSTQLFEKSQKVNFPNTVHLMGSCESSWNENMKIGIGIVCSSNTSRENQQNYTYAITLDGFHWLNL